MPSQPVPTVPDEPSGSPSQGVRTLITLLLFFHLFALSAGVAGNFGARSGLRRQLREDTPIQPYLRTLWLDTGYDFGLIYNNPFDFDHQCEIELHPANDPTTSAEAQDDRKFINLMPEGIWNGLRRHRYLALAQKLRLYQGENNEEADLVAALARGMLQRANIDDGAHLFRCLVQQTQDLVSLEEIDPELRDPEHEGWIGTFYEADLILDQNRWSPSKREERGSMTQSRKSRQRSR
jgi:hypothetical protein